MRKNDVPGSASRTAAVYESVRREFLLPQLELSRTKYGVGSAVASLIQVWALMPSDPRGVASVALPVARAVRTAFMSHRLSRARTSAPKSGGHGLAPPLWLPLAVQR